MSIQIAITESYLSSVFKLDNQSKKQTLNTIKQLADNPRSTSLQIHSLERVKCDPKFRSARVNSDIRVILAMQGNNTYTLLYVDHHDDAYDWCEGKFLAKTNFGAEYVFDEKTLLQAEGYTAANNANDFFGETPLLESAEIKAKHLERLGIPEIHAINLLTISSEDKFIDYIDIFPAELQEALLDLATGVKNFDTVYNELTDVEFNSEDSEVQQKDTKRRFYITQSMDELELLMENEAFEKWTLFLHPSQEKLVKKDFSGPALVEGGPGTGKTIVGIHRAAFLAEHIYKAEDGKRILFCTFSKKLAKSISEKLELLLKQRGIKNNIDVVGVDSFIFSALREAKGFVPPVNPSAFTNLLNRLYATLQPKGSKGFYEYEFFEVIEKFNIQSLEEYLTADRSGTGLPLDKKGRTLAWQFIEKLLAEKHREQIYTFVDRTRTLLDAIENGTYTAQYDSIIIDEAQDLEPIKLRTLCRCVRTTQNNILILSDMNQRIFKLTTWKKDGGINVVGRSHHLSLNYRTTKQINDYARYQFIHSEMITAHIKEYKSIMTGSDPTVIGFSDDRAQYQYVVKCIKDLLASGYAPRQICVICPSKDECNQIDSILTFSELNTTLLFDDAYPTQDSGICICPISGVKGLEFEVVIVYHYNNIGKNRLKDKDSPEVKINYNKLVECEKYVAATRARNELIVTYLESGDDE